MEKIIAAAKALGETLRNSDKYIYDQLIKMGATGMQASKPVESIDRQKQAALDRANSLCIMTSKNMAEELTKKHGEDRALSGLLKLNEILVARFMANCIDTTMPGAMYKTFIVKW